MNFMTGIGEHPHGLGEQRRRAEDMALGMVSNIGGAGARVMLDIEAMEALEECNGALDLVVSDVVMPEMDGPTLLKVMREKNPDIKIIFVSGYAEDAFEKSLPENQQFAFLPKPFTLSQLVAAVKETMAPQ